MRIKGWLLSASVLLEAGIVSAQSSRARYFGDEDERGGTNWPLLMAIFSVVGLIMMWNYFEGRDWLGVAIGFFIAVGCGAGALKGFGYW